MSVAAVDPGGSEVVVLPVDALAEQFPSRRVAVRADNTAEISGLPEGSYRLQLVPRGVQALNLTGTPWGTPVRITGGATAEVTVTR